MTFCWQDSQLGGAHFLTILQSDRGCANTNAGWTPCGWNGDVEYSCSSDLADPSRRIVVTRLAQRARRAAWPRHCSGDFVSSSSCCGMVVLFSLAVMRRIVPAASSNHESSMGRLVYLWGQDVSSRFTPQPLHQPVLLPHRPQSRPSLCCVVVLASSYELGCHVSGR